MTWPGAFLLAVFIICFMVIIVNGPTFDGIEGIIRAWRKKRKEDEP